MNNKIGAAILTCNRVDFFKQCLASIPGVETLIVVNDGKPYDSDVYTRNVKEVIQHSSNKCVGISKNEALRYLIQDGCQHLFLIEDDMLIKNPDVFNAYIKAAEASGIWHLNFAYHGPANFKPGQYGVKNPRQIVDYENGIEIGLNPNSVGSFSYYLRGVIKSIGYMDERFQNAWEHVDHTYRIIKAGLHPPFWWFADLANSDEYINELASSEVNSVIRKTSEWTEGMQKGAQWYAQKHGFIPTKTPDTPPEKVLAICEDIQKKYAKKIL